MYSIKSGIVNVVGWIGPIALLGLSIIVLHERGGIWSKPSARHTWIEAEGISETIPIPIVRSAAEDAGHKWQTNGDTLLLVAIGTRVCFGSLVEVDDYALAVREASTGEEKGGHVTPVALVLSESFSTARRFARLAELSMPTVPVAEPDLLQAFGFEADQPNKQVVVLVDAQSGRVLRNAVLSSAPTPTESKIAFLQNYSET